MLYIRAPLVGVIGWLGRSCHRRNGKDTTALQLHKRQQVQRMEGRLQGKNRVCEAYVFYWPRIVSV